GPHGTGAISPPSNTTAGTNPTSHRGALVSRTRREELARSREPLILPVAGGGAGAGRREVVGRGGRCLAVGAAGRRFAVRRGRGRLLDTVLLARSLVVRWNATMVPHRQGAQC
ncbi:MAG TPA: hypothetical protein VFI46_03440, partial [Jiangellaceae bacterium]|nr:hypothetical protein [Jiangellaceae bacterium]